MDEKINKLWEHLSTGMVLQTLFRFYQFFKCTPFFIPGSDARSHVTFSCHLLSLLRSFMGSLSFIVFHKLDTFEEYRFGHFYF